jgi:hypothetical protein
MRLRGGVGSNKPVRRKRGRGQNGETPAKRGRDSEQDAVATDGGVVGEPKSPAEGVGARSGDTPVSGGSVVSGLLHDMKSMLLQGKLPAPLPATAKKPKKGPGSEHRTPQLVGWGKNPGGNVGIELPEGGLAGGGLVPEPLRVEFARRLANASDTAALFGHKLVMLCDNVSVDLDPLTGRGAFAMDVDAALDCIDKVCMPAHYPLLT